jgi:mono/diheme cytochrome c family protein
MRVLRGLSVAFALAVGVMVHAQEVNPCPDAQPVPAGLKLPSFIPPGEPVAVEKQLLAYLSTLDYRGLGWCRDKWVRDTGPLIQGTASIVHPAVHIYYSPEVSNWLVNGRKGEIPDGAVIIKEQFSPIPAARYRDIAEKDLGCSNDWTIMIKDSRGSFDGWFWAEVWNGSKPSNSMKFDNPFQYPNAGYGLVCLRCHSSAEKQHTFVSLSNIEGSPGWPLQFRVDDSWRSTSAPLPPKTCGFGGTTLIDLVENEAAPLEKRPRLEHEEAIAPALFPEHEQNAAIQENVKALALVKLLRATPADVQKLPPEPLDDVVAEPANAPVNPAAGFVTSSQCTGCHSGLTGAGLGPTMVLTSSSSPTINVSPYGEWRWTPMGLAGRDPVFYSQVDSELAYLEKLKKQDKQQGVIDTCTQCHKNYKLEFVNDSDPHSEGFRVGGLARDGISCEVCHRMQAPKDPSLPYFLDHQINGVFNVTPPGELHGPFKDNEITTYPMLTGVNVKPKFDAYIQSPQMCGTCHTILLPVLDSPKPGKMSVEQATYPEWLNSDYRDEYGSVGATPKTCQDCHMPAGYVNDKTHVNVATIKDKIAIVQDGTYAAVEHLAKPDDVNVRYRETGFKRHELLGTNGFLLQMFLKPVNELGNNEVLGVRLSDYMSGLNSDLQAASNNVVQQAQTITATVEISKWEVEGDKLIVEVTVTNKAGHRFPSGVGFRRSFLDLEATVDGKPFFRSGATNSMGQITNFAGQVLPTESFVNGAYQPHFNEQNPITSSDQVQIYEELTKDASGQFTTEFTRRDVEVKDNRLLPIGWSLHGPKDLHIPEPYLEATVPKGDALKDPVYLAGKGQSVVRYEIPLPAGANASDVHATVSLYSQTLPPYFLADRYQTKTPATGRLEFLANSLGTLKGTDYENWKLLVGKASK